MTYLTSPSYDTISSGLSVFYPSVSLPGKTLTQNQPNCLPSLLLCLLLEINYSTAHIEFTKNSRFLPLRASLIAQLVKNLPTCRRPQFNSWVGKIIWQRDRLSTPVFLGIPCDSAGKESTCNAGDLGLIAGLGNPLEKAKATHSSYLAWRIPWTV